MAHDCPSSWTEFEKFNVSFDRVAFGWSQLDPFKTASAVEKKLGLKVQPADQMPVPGRLFMVGNLGRVGVEPRPDTLKKLGGGLGLGGALSVRLRGMSLAGPYLKMEQRIRGIPVFGSQLALHLNPKGVAYALTGTPFPAKTKMRAVSRKVGAKAAAEVVARALRTKSTELSWTAERTLLPGAAGLLPCFHVKAAAWEPFGVWYGFVGVNGKLLALYNVASSAVSTANGYKVNPLRTPQLLQVQLENLVGRGNRLNGANSQVWGPGPSQVPATGGAFLFPPNLDEFDQPQLYSFLDECRNAAATIAKGQWSKMVQKEKKFNPMKGSVHVAQAANNAFYWPDTGELFFGDILIDPNETRYTSRSLDIILHEFGHAISDTICQLGRTSSHTQSRGMSEGYSDYFAATVLDNPVMGDYFVKDPAGFRTCANSKKFPAGYAGEEHDVGNVWSGFLWDLRKDSTIGKAVADAITLQSLTYLGPWRTILQGLDAVLQADRTLYPDPAGSGQGQHEQAIQAAFHARKP